MVYVRRILKHHTRMVSVTSHCDIVGSMVGYVINSKTKIKYHSLRTVPKSQKS